MMDALSSAFNGVGDMGAASPLLLIAIDVDDDLLRRSSCVSTTASLVVVGSLYTRGRNNRLEESCVGCDISGKMVDKRSFRKGP